MSEWCKGLYVTGEFMMKPAVNNKKILVVKIGCSNYAVSSREEFLLLFGEAGKQYLEHTTTVSGSPTAPQGR
jgi:hypothetical protein